MEPCYLPSGMAKIDNRSLDHKVLEHIRLLAVDRVLAGEKPSAVAKSFGIYRTSIYKWLRAQRKRGRQALRSTTAKGPTPKLTDSQKRQVRRWVIGKDPRQYGFDFGLWTRSIIAEMIRDRFEVSLTLPSVGRLLASLDITPQKPLRRAYERDEKEIRKWIEEKYPALRKRAKQRGADIFFLDEVGVRSDSPLGRSYGLKGKTPVVKTSGQRQKINAISAVNAKGAFWYKVYSGMLGAALFIVMLKDLMKGRKNPVMLVVDGLPAHKAKSVAKYVQSTQGRLELHFLPPYAPDLNPDEFVWSHLKQNGTSKKPLRKNEALRQRVETDLAEIKQDRSLVRSFFKAPSVSYAIY
jgi:transposase